MEADVARLKSERAELEANQRRCHEAVDVDAVAEGLNRLGETLGGENASATNLMLAQHIESIVCDENGKVLVRTCKLGCLAVASDLLSTSEHIGRNELPDAKHPGKPRRRARLNVGDAIEDEDYVAAANQIAVEPSRFPGLGPEWFHEDYFEVPRTLSWAEANAREVADYRLTQSATMEATAEHFGKTVPTIRAALRYARDLHGLDAFGKVVSQPKRRTWPEQNAAAVWQYFQSNECSMKGAVAQFGKSEPTIRKARELGRQAASDEAD